MKDSESAPSRNVPCPCGSGKKYKKCCGAQVVGGYEKPRSWRGPLIAVGIIAVLAFGSNIVRQQARGSGSMGGARAGVTDYLEIYDIDMSQLTDEQRVTVMQRANREQCTCGCRMTLAQCINTDATCPLRRRNLRRARTLVTKAQRSS